MSKKYNGEDLPNLDLNTRNTPTNILAVVRCRPLLPRDIAGNVSECVTVPNEQSLIVTEPYDSDGHTGSDKSRRLQFEFPRVFNKNVTNQEIYEWTTKPLLAGLFDGLNATVFAYGASQSGKTYTMSGNGENNGIIGYAINDLLSSMNQDAHSDAVLKVSYIEIYNENIRDLLVNDDKAVDIREDPTKGIVLHNISEIVTSQKKDITKMLK